MDTKDWHPADIVAAVRKLGTTLRSLSISHGLTPNACQTAMHRPYKDPEQVIAAALGLHPKQIWPSRYSQNGERKRFLHSKMVPKDTSLSSKSVPVTKTVQASGGDK